MPSQDALAPTTAAFANIDDGNLSSVCGGFTVDEDYDYIYNFELNRTRHCAKNIKDAIAYAQSMAMSNRGVLPAGCK